MGEMGKEPIAVSGKKESIIIKPSHMYYAGKMNVMRGVEF